MAAQTEPVLLDENWRWVPGHEGVYSVSDKGRVYRLIATGRHNRHKPGFVALTDKGGGYKRACIGGKLRYVHILVATVFIGAAPFKGAEVNHIDGDPSNNNVVNLEWTNRIGNSKHMMHQLGRGNRKITLEIANLIRQKHDGKRGANVRLAREFNISAAQISNIIRGKQW